jgi:hypothetical protein
LSCLFFSYIPARDTATLALSGTCTTQEPGHKELYITLAAFLPVVSCLLVLARRSVVWLLAKSRIALMVHLHIILIIITTADMGIFGYDDSAKDSPEADPSL